MRGAWGSVVGSFDGCRCSLFVFSVLPCVVRSGAWCPICPFNLVVWLVLCGVDDGWLWLLFPISSARCRCCVLAYCFSFVFVVGCLSQVSSRDSRRLTAIHVIVAYHIHASIIVWCHHARFSGSAWLLCRLLDGSMFRRLHGKLSGTMFIDSFIVYACLFCA